MVLNQRTMPYDHSHPLLFSEKEKDVGYLSMYTQLWATCAIFVPCLTEMGILFYSGAKIRKKFLKRGIN